MQRVEGGCSFITQGEQGIKPHHVPATRDDGWERRRAERTEGEKKCKAKLCTCLES